MAPRRHPRPGGIVHAVRGGNGERTAGHMPGHHPEGSGTPRLDGGYSVGMREIESLQFLFPAEGDGGEPAESRAQGGTILTDLIRTIQRICFPMQGEAWDMFKSASCKIIDHGSP